jgi:hypothetical protein
MNLISKIYSSATFKRPVFKRADKNQVKKFYESKLTKSLRAIDRGAMIQPKRAK